MKKRGEPWTKHWPDDATLAVIGTLPIAAFKMRRGSVVRQFLKVKLRGRKDPVLSGPYALFSRKRAGQTEARRLHDPEEVRRLEEQVENYHAFRRLCTELVEVSEQICDERDKER